MNKESSSAPNKGKKHKMSYRKRHSKSHSKDYSSEWLHALQSIDITRSQVHLMLTAIDKLNMKYPPRILPPIEQINASSSPTHTHAAYESYESNTFNALNIRNSDSEDESDNNDINEHVISEKNTHKSIQVRYLRVKIICRLVECIRQEAMDAQRRKDYNNMKLLWEEAWQTLFQCQVSIDEWYALMTAHESSRHILPKKHDKIQLKELFTGLDLLVEDSERHRHIAISFLTKRRQFVLEKLYPMLKERDEVKQSIGEENWKRNPAPQQTYAERRRQWEAELRIINEALVSIQVLDFDTLLPSSA